jgi:hypothetical protein
MIMDPRIQARLPYIPKTPPTNISYSSPIGRWAGVGPYYAMFPVPFAFEVVARYSKPGSAVLDPFAGRASSIYAAVAQGRTGYGIEINPVGWVYGKVKLAPATKGAVLKCVEDIGGLCKEVSQHQLDELPEFFHICYGKEVLKYLVTAREHLKWKTSRVDATLMVMLLVNLHGKLGSCLSNQMRQGKAMDPGYSVRWWKSREMKPPEIDPIKFLYSRIEWRYAKGIPKLGPGHIEWGDSTTILKRLSGYRQGVGLPKFDLLFTSPPYYGLTNYFYDQWLRIWMLGGSSAPTYSGKLWEKKFESKVEYRHLLEKVFEGCAENLTDDAVVYIRTDARQFTLDTTCEVLKKTFPKKRLYIIDRPFTKATQTALYGDKSAKPGEIDIVMN